MAKLHGYESMLLSGEELMYCIHGVYDISQPASTVGTLYITSFQTFFVDEARDQLKALIPHGCISSLKKYKSQNTNNVPLTDKHQYMEIRCKDLRVFKYVLPTSSRPVEVKRFLENAAVPDNLYEIFSFSYSPQVAALDEGWNVYNPLEEYRRIGLIGEEAGSWRLSEFNANFATSPTYPEVFVVPSGVTDKILEKVAEFRSKARIPVCVWKHKTTSATISRCSQPLVGIGRRSEDDELLLREIQQSNKDGKGKTLYIVDARPKVNAAACTLSGGGTEIVGNYSDANVSLEYCGIANIHVVRESFKKLGKVCKTWDPRKSKWSDVVNTHWLDHISSILIAACRMVTYVDVDGCSVLTHCTDGWDRTSQLCALAELLMDPYYRTIKGLVVLICKEFISFGHKFNTRNGNISHSPRSQCAPIFVQFMDCVWQLTRQFPTSFEFSENLLLLITTHLYTNLFGTFLCDNDSERASFSLQTQTASLWGLILQAPPTLAALFVNPMYAPHPGTLHGNGNANSMQLWRRFYQRDHTEKDDTNDKKEEVLKVNGVHGNGDARVVDTTLLHEMVLLPFLDSLSHTDQAAVRKEMDAWLSMGGGKPREKIRVVITPRNKSNNSNKELNKDAKEEKFGTMRSASQSKGVNKNVPPVDDEAEGEDELSDRGGIKRGRSFSNVFAKMTGRGTIKDKGRGKHGEDKEDDKESHHQHHDAHSTSSSSSPSVRIIGSHSRKDKHEGSHNNNGTEDNSTNNAVAHSQPQLIEQKN